MKRIIAYIKDNKILVLLIIVVFQNIYLQMESMKIKESADNAEYYAKRAEDSASDAASYASDAVDEAKDAAYEAHRAYTNSFGYECYSCPN